MAEDNDALTLYDKNDRNRSTVSTIVGAISAVAIATALLYNFGIIPLQANINNIATLRENDRKEIREIYSTIGALTGFKELASAKFEGLNNDIARHEQHLLLIDGLARDRAAPIASIAQIDGRLIRLTDRFNETQQRMSPSIADEIKELRAELRALSLRMLNNGVVK